MDWTVTPTAFGGALVEFVEAAIIVVAAAGLAGWRPALRGSAAGLAVLTLALVALGTTLVRMVPQSALHAVVGALLLLFGVKWLAKATLRLGAPRRPGGHGEPAPGADRAAAAVAAATAFNGVLLEGAEVVFIVLALGATGRAMGSAVAGAGAAAVLCALAAVAARGPLSRVPDVALKFTVGVMLTTFGTFWLGGALGIRWVGQDAALAWLAVGNAALALLAVWNLRRGRISGGVAA